jgi:hypothetical protein
MKLSPSIDKAVQDKVPSVLGSSTGPKPSIFTGPALNGLTLFMSSGTLICCALPALLVSLGMGASLVGLIGVFPQVVWLSEHKALVFGISGFMLAVSGFWLWKAQFMPCPADPKLAQACAKSRSFSKYTYGISLFIYLLGFFFAFVAPRIL